MATAAPDAATYAELLVTWRADPVAFVGQALGWTPTPWQGRILRNVAEGGTTAVRTGHATGKTAMAAAAVQWALAVFDAVTIVTTAPTFNQVRTLLWAEIASQQARARWPLGGRLNQTEFTLGPECRAFGLSTDKPDKFQGQHGVGSKAWGLETADRASVFVVVDESSGVKTSIHDAVTAIATGANDRVLHIGNPTDSQSRFATFFGPQSSAKQIHVSSLEAAAFAEQHGVPGLCSRAWCEDARTRFGESSAYYRSRVLGEFPEEGEDILIRLAWIEAANRRWDESDYECQAAECQWWERAAPEVVLGVDLARHGGDRIAWAVRQGQDIAYLESWEGTDDLSKVYAHTKALIAQWRVQRTYLDATGLLADSLIDMGFAKDKIAAQAVNFGSAALRPGFVNRRSELWWNLREWLRLGRGALPESEECLRDLLAPRYTFSATDERFSLESKEAMRKRAAAQGLTFTSPDIADAVALALIGAEAPGALPIVAPRLDARVGVVRRRTGLEAMA